MLIGENIAPGLPGPRISDVKNKPPAPAPTTVSRGLRLYLYFTAALTGAAIMIVEILGAKMLSPYVGTSHFVWTAQIAVALLALAVGYYAGGRLADRSQNLAMLYLAILGAAAYLVVTVLICAPVAYWCLDFNLAIGSLMASGILYFVPLALLAMTAPFLVRVVTASVTVVGGTVGRLTAIGTLGSFAGTVCIGYVMLPLLHNSVAMYLTAAALALVSGGYFVRFRRRSTLSLATAACLVAAAGLLAILNPSRQPASLRELFRGNSNFGTIQVAEWQDESYRFFANDNLAQNTYDPATKQSASTFTYALARLAHAYTTNLNDALCIGMGVGIVPMEFARSGIQVDVVEINPAVVPVATRFFDFEPQKVGLTIDDGRHFLNRCRKQYDAVILDAFLGDSSPSHLMTREAFSAIRNVLRPGGVLVINAFGDVQQGKDFFAASLNRTLQSVFSGVRVHGDGGQIYLVATDRPDPEFVHPPNLEGIHPRAHQRTLSMFRNLVTTAPDHGLVLTDDFNPVEFFDAHNREELRRRLALGARDW